MRNYKEKFKQQAGLSLVELMIAMVLGLLLSGVAIQIFASNKSTYRLENELSRLQENGRFIVENMVKDIRMAGYNGCTSRTDNFTVNIIAEAPIPFTIDGTDSIRGYNNNNTGWLPAIDVGINLNDADNPDTTVVQGTDVLNIQRAANCGAHVAGTMAPSNVNLEVTSPNGCDFEQNQVVMVTDCTAADVYQVSNDAEMAIASGKQTVSHSDGGGTGPNTTDDLSKAYGADSLLFKWQSNSYFIGTSPNSAQPALFKSAWNPDADTDIDEDDFTVFELADGIEDMQLLYGEDTGGDEYADVYVTANNVTDWSNVISVRINLLLRSIEQVTTEPRSIVFNGNTVNSGSGADRRLRMAYTTTVSIRNRLP